MSWAGMVRAFGPEEHGAHGVACPFHELFCNSLKINHTYSERPKSFRGTACRGLPALPPCAVGRALLCAPPRAPGAFINDAFSLISAYFHLPRKFWLGAERRCAGRVCGRIPGPLGQAGMKRALGAGLRFRLKAGSITGQSGCAAP
jgi:hypothetical protein